METNSAVHGTLLRGRADPVEPTRRMSVAHCRIHTVVWYSCARGAIEAVPAL